MKEKAKLTIVLVKPKYPFNLGLIARTMKNFEVESLYLVGVSDELIKRAIVYSSRGREVLENAKRFSTLEEAFDKGSYRIGTSAKIKLRSDIKRAYITLEELRKLYYTKENIQLFFGNEATGLTNEELSKMDVNLNILSSKKYPTLNLAISVAIVLHDYFNSGVPEFRYKAASTQQIEGFLRAYEYFLKSFDFKEERIMKSLEAMKVMVGRCTPSSTEIGILSSNFRKAGTLYRKLQENLKSRH